MIFYPWPWCMCVWCTCPWCGWDFRISGLCTVEKMLKFCSWHILCTSNIELSHKLNTNYIQSDMIQNMSEEGLCVVFSFALSYFSFVALSPKDLRRNFEYFHKRCLRPHRQKIGETRSEIFHKIFLSHLTEGSKLRIYLKFTTRKL